MTRRGALIELAIVTAGVLIALSFDTVRQWRANDALAAEARANLLNEIGQNKKQLDLTLEQTEKNQKDFMSAHSRIQDVLAGKPLGEANINLNNRIANLSGAGYQTAEITGAFGYMGYEEVRKFAGLYDMQARYVRLQDEAVGSLSQVGAPIRLAGGPDKLSRPELESVKAGLERAIGQLDVQWQIGKILTEVYARALKDVESDE